MTWTTKAHQLRVVQAQQVATILQELDTHDQRTLDDVRYTTTAGGDNQKLRGIPAIGRGVPGCIPGTSPHSIR